MKKLLTNNIIFKIISVVFAIALWLIVLNLDDPNTTKTVSNIPVTITNESAITGQNMVYKIVQGDVAKVSVTGPRSIVDKLTSSDFVATADFNLLSQTNAVPITVELKKEYSNRENVTVTNKTYSMRLEIEEIEEKEFEIKVKNTGETAENYVIFNNTLSDRTVVVSAPRSLMNTIAGVVVYVKANGNTSDFQTEATFVYLDSSGREIKVSQDDIKTNIDSVVVNSKVLYSKDIAIGDSFEEVLVDGYSIVKKEYSEQTVKLVGNKSTLENMGSLNIPSALLGFDENKKDYSIECDIQSILPENIYVYESGKKINISLHIDKTTVKTYVIDVKKLALTNIPEGYDASIVSKGTFTYELSGYSDVLRDYNTQDTYSVSLEGLTEGTASVPVTIEVYDGIQQVGECLVEVSLKKSDDETTTETTEGVTSNREDETTTSDNSQGHLENTTSANN